MTEDEERKARQLAATREALAALRAAGDEAVSLKKKIRKAMEGMNVAALEAAQAGVEPAITGIRYARVAGVAVPAPRSREEDEGTNGLQALAALFEKLPETERSKSDRALTPILGPLAGLAEGPAASISGRSAPVVRPGQLADGACPSPGSVSLRPSRRRCARPGSDAVGEFAEEVRVGVGVVA
ncbi:hypothetical protein ABT174_35040 [Streptomyces sparsogenes]|uniref:hypothetical protein n=1 Tax=Streptomyces sparsogenes TaxID=67365 RepID=UPI00332BE65A